MRNQEITTEKSETKSFGGFSGVISVDTNLMEWIITLTHNKATKTVVVYRDWIGGSFPKSSAFFNHKLSKPVVSFESAWTTWQEAKNESIARQILFKG